MKEFFQALTYFIGTGELILSFYFIKTHSGNEIRKVIAGLSAATGLWVILSGLTNYHGLNTIQWFYLNCVYTFGILLLTTLLYFSIIYPVKTFYFDRLHALLIYIPAVLFTLFIFGTRVFVTNFTGSDTSSGAIVGGPLYLYYNAYLVILYLVSLTLLFIKRNTPGYSKDIKILLAGLVIGGMPGVFVDLIAPFLKLDVSSLPGVLTSVFWLGSVVIILRGRR